MIAIETLRAWLGLTDDSADSILEVLEAAAVAQVEQHLGLPAGGLGSPAERVDVMLGSGSAVLFLPAAGATGTITLVEERPWPGGSATVLAAGTDYERRGNTLVRRASGWWHPEYEYAITAPVGYAADAVPPMIRKAVLDLVSIAYRAQGAEDLQSETIGDYSYTRATAPNGRSAADAVLATLPRRVRV